MSAKKVQPGYGKLPSAVVSGGAFRELGRNELAVYLQIAAHVSGSSWDAWPSVKTIADAAGYCERTVQRVMGKLTERGLIRVTPGGGRKRPNLYRLTTELPRNPDTQDVTVSTRNPDIEGVTVSREKPRQIDPERVTKRDGKGDKTDPKPRHPGCHPNSLTAEQQNSRGGTAAGGRDEDGGGQAKHNGHVRMALIAAGIGEPVLSELAANPRLTVGTVQDIAGESRSRGKGPGITIENIRTALASAEADRQSQQREKDAAAAAKATAATEEAESRRREDAAARWIARLSDEEVETLYARLLAEHPDTVPLAIRSSTPSAAGLRAGFASELFTHFAEATAGVET